MGAIATRGDEAALKLFREVLLASSSIPGFFSPVVIDAEANGKKLQEMHSDGTLTAPFFVMPEAMLSAGSGSSAPFSQLYVIVNSRARGLNSRCRTATFPVCSAVRSPSPSPRRLRAELMLPSRSARRSMDLALRVAHVGPGLQSSDPRPVRRQIHAGALRVRGRRWQGWHGFFGNSPPDLSMRGSNKQ